MRMFIATVCTMLLSSSTAFAQSERPSEIIEDDVTAYLKGGEWVPARVEVYRDRLVVLDAQTRKEVKTIEIGEVGIMESNDGVSSDEGEVETSTPFWKQAAGFVIGIGGLTWALAELEKDPDDQVGGFLIITGALLSTEISTALMDSKSKVTAVFLKISDLVLRLTKKEALQLARSTSATYNLALKSPRHISTPSRFSVGISPRRDGFSTFASFRF